MATDRDRVLPGVLRGALAFALGLIALLLWLNRDYVSSQFAASCSVTVRLVTPTNRDDERLDRAFAAAQAARPSDAKLDAESKRRIREAYVLAPSKGEALEAARSFTQALAAAFDAEGKGALDTRVSGRAYAVPDATSNAVSTVLTFGAPALGLLASVLLMLAWRERIAVGDFKVPRGAGVGFAASLVFPVALLVLPGWLFMALFAMAIPTAIAGLIVYKMHEVHRASRWPSAQGRIVRSKTRTVETKEANDSPSRGNLPDIEYVFSVDGVEHRGKRIGIGEIKPDSPEVEAALERYHVGRTGPVYYNPDKPEEAVLERDAPASPATMYAVAAGVMVVGLTVVVAFTRIGEIIAWLQPRFPPGAIVHAFLFFLACGLVASVILISDLASALAAARWPTAAGTVLSSRAEPRRTLVPGGQGQTAVMWSPLVEYGYRVGARDYHGARIAFGPAFSGARELADVTVARYTTGATVTVHYDPANPSQSTLETRVAFRWLSLVVTAAFFAAALFFSGRFGSYARNRSSAISRSLLRCILGPVGEGVTGNSAIARTRTGTL